MCTRTLSYAMRYEIGVGAVEAIGKFVMGDGNRLHDSGCAVAGTNRQHGTSAGGCEYTC